MIPRYTNKEMGDIWSDHTKFSIWLEVEKAVAKAQAEMGVIPKAAANDIEEKADFDIKGIDEIEKVTNHDVIAFLTNVSGYIGDSSKYLHFGLTSSDVGDTALSLQIARSADIILKKQEALLEVLKKQAKRYKDTVMVGRTHGIHAEPTTLGLKIAIWAF